MARPRKPQKLLGIEKRGNAYSYRLRVPNPDTPNQFKQVRFGGFTTPEEADKDRARRKIELYENRFILPTQMTIEEFFPRFIEEHIHFSGIKLQSGEGYRIIVRAYILPRLGHLHLQECTSELLESFLLESQKSGTRQGTELAQSMLEKIALVLSMGFKEAQRKRLVGFNPMSEVRVPKGGKKKKVVHLSDIELSKFRQVWLTSKYADFFELALATGARKGELIALRWQDFDEKERTLSISKTLYELKGERLEGSPKSPNSVRKVEIALSQCQRLRAHRAQQAQQRLHAGAHWHNDDYIFTNEIGQPLASSSLYDEWKRICQKAKMERKHLHALRHTHITSLLQAGVAPYVVARRAGDKVTTILTTYAHAVRNDDARCAEVFEQKMASL